MKTAPENSADVLPEDNHRNAFNAAFSELHLNWNWDLDTYRGLMGIGSEKARIRAYLEAMQPNLLATYDPDFLIDAIYAAKSRWYRVMACPGDADMPPRSSKALPAASA